MKTARLSGLAFRATVSYLASRADFFPPPPPPTTRPWSSLPPALRQPPTDVVQKSPLWAKLLTAEVPSRSGPGEFCCCWKPNRRSATRGRWSWRWKKKTSGYKSVLNCSITPLAIEKSKMLVVRDGAKSQGDDRFVVHGLKKRERLSRSWRRGPIRTWYACSFALKQASGQPWSEQICSNIKRPAFAHHTVWMNFIEF